MRSLKIVTASTRPGRFGPTATAWLLEEIRRGRPDLVSVTTVIDLAEAAPLSLDEPVAAVEGEAYQHEHTRRWSQLVDEADAFVFVMPEYNTGYSGALKIALDSLYGEWGYKPVGFVNYGMKSGGMRAAEQLKPVLTALKMVPVHENVTIHLRDHVDTEGRFHPTPRMTASAADMLAELELLAGALSPLRRAQARELAS